MGARAAGVAATRERIVLAARDLHVEQGLAATNWEDIAERAGLSAATVYRQFPSLSELVPACARTVFDIIQPPTLEQAGAMFGQRERASDRFDQLVRQTCHCYADGADWLHAAHRERDFVPELDDALRVIEDALRVLIKAAAGRRLPKGDLAVLFVLCDFPTWWSLRQTSLSTPATEDTVVRLVLTEIARIGLDNKE